MVYLFSGSFQAFTGALSATGTVQVGGPWQSVALNGTLSGVTVLGVAANTMTFYGPNVFGTGGEGWMRGSASYPDSPERGNGGSGDGVVS